MIALRPMLDVDKPLVFSSWLESYSRGRWARQWPRAFYFGAHRLFVEALLPHAAVMLACAEDDPSVILGWACTGPGRLVHYVYVKPRVRHLGIAHKLLAPFLDGAPVTCTAAQDPQHDRYTGKRAVRLPEGWTYDPHAIILGREHAA